MISKKPIRLVGLDLDGTLLNEQNKLTPDVVQAFSRVRQSNLDVVVITGRDKLSALPFLQQLKAERTVITSGGAQIWLNGELISQTCFTHKQVSDILTIGLEYTAGMYVDKQKCTWRYGVRQYTDMFGHLSDSKEIINGGDLLNSPTFKISLIQEPPVLEVIHNRLTELHPRLTITSPFDKVLDVNPKGGNKGEALTRLADQLGIALKQVAVAGDSENDLSMFDVAGMTFAMGNSVAALRDYADFIAPTNAKEGILWVLNKIIETGL